jgi:glycosyltransferase involved in cell wall biosynthesis
MRAMGEEGRLRIERHFTIEDMIENTVKAYGEVLAGG